MTDSDMSFAKRKRAASADYLPTASLDTLRRRADLLAALREFFTTNGYFEVETPILSHDVVTDAHLEPFATGCEGDGELFLQTSPEFGMKRLLAAGAQAMFQVTRAFRRGEIGRHHNPEFTMVEWYRAGDTHFDQMDFVERLILSVLDGAAFEASSPFERLTYDEAFERYAGSRVLSVETSRFIELAKERDIAIPGSLSPDDRDGWLNLLLAELVEPHLGRDAPTFLYDYPASQASLARVRLGTPDVAERFELYIAGIEICNGYHELTDATELRRRIAAQAQIRAADGRRKLPAESRLLAAMEAGLPASAGVALGFDRLAMLALGKTALAEVLAFPIDRA